MTSQNVRKGSAASSFKSSEFAHLNMAANGSPSHPGFDLLVQQAPGGGEAALSAEERFAELEQEVRSSMCRLPYSPNRRLLLSLQLVPTDAILQPHTRSCMTTAGAGATSGVFVGSLDRKR